MTVVDILYIVSAVSVAVESAEESSRYIFFAVLYNITYS
jgi:hypothetical protein